MAKVEFPQDESALLDFLEELDPVEKKRKLHQYLRYLDSDPRLNRKKVVRSNNLKHKVKKPSTFDIEKQRVETE